MPTISNLQGNLRLSSGVFEVVQGTGIIPRLYTSSTVAPIGITTGLSIRIDPYTTPWSRITGYNFGLKFNSDLDLRYHLQNQYWLFLTGQSPSGPFSIYSGAEGIQSNSTGINILRNSLPATFYPKALVLPLDIESKLSKMFNSGSYALAANDKLNFGIIDFPSEKINVSGNILLRSPESEKFVRFSTKNGGVVDFGIASHESKKSSPNVTIGQGNFIEYYNPDAFGEYPDSNYLVGKDNVLFCSGNQVGTPKGILINGFQNTTSGINEAVILGTLNRAFSGKYILLNGSNNLSDKSYTTMIFGRNSSVTNGDRILLVGDQNVLDPNLNKSVNSTILGLANNILIPTGINNLSSVSSLLVGSNQYIFSSGSRDISLVGRNNAVNTLTSDKFYEASNLSIYGNYNKISGQTSNIDLFGDQNFILNSSNITYLGDSNSSSGVFNSSLLGSSNFNTSIDSTSLIGNNNIVYNAIDCLSMGKLNQIGPGAESKGFAIVSGVLVPSGDTKNFSISGGIAIGYLNKHGINYSLTVGVGNKNYSVGGDPASGSNNIVYGNYNTSSGSKNIILGAFSEISQRKFFPNQENISVGYNNIVKDTINTSIIGNQNDIASTSGAGYAQTDSNYILGSHNYFRNSSNNIALGVGNEFYNESGKLKLNIPEGASFTLTKTTADFGSAVIKAKDIKIDLYNETEGVADTLAKIDESRLLSRFDSTQSSIFGTAISGSSSTFSLSDRIYDDDFATIKMPAQIELSSSISGLSGTFATGVYDLYYLPTYGKFTGLGAINTISSGLGRPYLDFVNGKAPFVEIRRASAVYDFIKKENITYGSPAFPWKVSYPYYFYAKFQAPDRYAIISYTSAFTSGITGYDTGNSDYTGECSKFKGLWALYTGAGHQYNNYNINNKPVLVNAYRSGQFSGWKYGDDSYLNPNEIPLYGWYGSGSWIESGIGQKLISGYNTFPTAPIGNSPITLKPVVDLKRVRFMSIALGYGNNIDNIPAAFIPIYY